MDFGINFLSSLWVFRRNELTSIDRTKLEKFKARLVTRRFQQIHGIDYKETFAPVVRFTTLRLLLALVASEDLDLFQMDFKTALLSEDLTEDIHMEQPEGCIKKPEQNYVYKLEMTLYGLKQALRQSFAKINSYLYDDLHFHSCLYDPCFYSNELKTKHL